MYNNVHIGCNGTLTDGVKGGNIILASDLLVQKQMSNLNSVIYFNSKILETGGPRLITINNTANRTVVFRRDTPGNGTGTLNNEFSGDLFIQQGQMRLDSVLPNNAGEVGPLGMSTNPIILGVNGTTGALIFFAPGGSTNRSFTLAVGGTGILGNSLTSSGGNSVLSGTI